MVKTGEKEREEYGMGGESGWETTSWGGSEAAGKMASSEAPHCREMEGRMMDGSVGRSVWAGDG